MNELGLIAVFIFYSKSSGVQARLALSVEFRMAVSSNVFMEQRLGHAVF